MCLTHHLETYLKQDTRVAYAYVFSEQECDLVTVLVLINLTLLLRKSCSVHMTVFEIVAHRNVDNWTDNLSIYIVGEHWQ